MNRSLRLQAKHSPFSWPERLSLSGTFVMLLLVGAILAVFLSALTALAQNTIQPMPENASAKSYGGGWECNVGFRQSGTICFAVIVPDNAYSTNRTYGLGWECLRGFRKTEDANCIAVKVPEGGYLDPSGERWRCLRGYIKVDDTCQKITLPAHAYLADASTGSAWICERGFRAKGESCVAIVVPKNSYLNGSSYGQPWTCKRGYFEQTGQCEAVIIPEHAYFDDANYGEGWKCDRGYSVSDQSCEPIDIPQNAHLDRSGNRWECDKNFQKLKGVCVLNN